MQNKAKKSSLKTLLQPWVSPTSHNIQRQTKQFTPIVTRP